MENITNYVSLIQVNLKRLNLKLQDDKVQNYLNKLAENVPDVINEYPLPWNQYHKLPEIALQELCKRLIEFHSETKSES